LDRAAVWAELGCGLKHSSGPAEESRGRRRTSADGLGPTRKKALFFLFFSLHFPNLIFNAKTFPRNPRKCFKAQKILRKFQKFHENSQS
jgi:hypothetical protein